MQCPRIYLKIGLQVHISNILTQHKGIGKVFTDHGTALTNDSKWWATKQTTDFQGTQKEYKNVKGLKSTALSMH